MADQVAASVPPELDGDRVDKALAVMLEVSRSTARDLIDAGVTIDGAPASPSDRVQAGAVIVHSSLPELVELTPEPVDFGVLHEDDQMLVIDKPAGVVVHPSSGRQGGTLAAGLLYRYPQLKGVGDRDRWGLVHRLDKDTSGAMIVALSTESHAALKEMIMRREVVRTYTALADGIIAIPTGTIDSPIGRDPARPRHRAVIRGGKPAITHYEVLDSFHGGDCSLLEVRLETGRTHQIRVHFAAIGHPVIGDAGYGSRTTRTGAPRQFLHASKVKLSHPATGETLEIESPLPPDLSGVLRALATE